MEASDEARPLTDLAAEIEEIDDLLRHSSASVLSEKPEYALLAHQAEWHARGLVYHLRAIYASYKHVAREVSARASTGADALFMYSPEMQKLIFEFYALVVLAEITLDELKKYVSPLFLAPGSVPNSITDILKGSTDCPLYAEYAREQLPLLTYLLDIRDCLVHHRSFATSDNSVAVREGCDVTEINGGEVPWPLPVTRLTFRHIDEERIAVNVLLPDAIF
jgi:hypothetical protein